MIYNDNLIEKFLFGKLKGKKLQEFQMILEQSSDLAFELKFNTELADAITETDIIDLRANIQSVFEPIEKPRNDENIRFGLSHQMDQTKISKTANADVFSFDHSLQYIHLENHMKTQTERIHLIKSENQNYVYLKGQQLSDNDLWNEISNSLQENDIIELRNNLKQITSSPSSEISDFEIDQFIDHDLSPESQVEIEKMMNQNQHIAAQVNLQYEINEAIKENDIHALRSTISNIIEEEQMISFNEIKRIDDYLLNYLDEKEQEDFEAIISNEPRMKKELKLNEHINHAILEHDVMSLRKSIKSITSEEKPDTSIRRFLPHSFKKSPARFIGAAASLAAIISVGTILLNQQNTSASELYEKFYQPYQATGLYRSSAPVTPEILGVDLYNQKDYQGAILQFNKVLSLNSEHPMCNFYSGLSYQEMYDFRKAINAYQKVIDEKDNLFIEQAEWYMALCYLKTDNKNKAYSTFNKILDKKGYYSNEVTEIIKGLK